MTIQNHTNTKPLIQLKHIKKKYVIGDHDFFALNGINLTISQGEFAAIVGKSGSGKSTLLNLLGGIDSPTEGSIEINGESIGQYNENQLCRFRGRNIGFIFQFFQLMPTLSVLENVLMPMDFAGNLKKAERRQRARNLLEKVGLENHLDKYPAALSGGEQQRVAIARALANEPDIIFADEPTGNLDSNTAEQIFQLLEGLAEEGKTLIMVTHNDELANRCSRILQMKDGKIITDSCLKSEVSYENQLS